jgi:hypothetical protein
MNQIMLLFMSSETHNEIYERFEWNETNDVGSCRKMKIREILFGFSRKTPENSTHFNKFLMN